MQHKRNRQGVRLITKIKRRRRGQEQEVRSRLRKMRAAREGRLVPDTVVQNGTAQNRVVPSMKKQLLRTCPRCGGMTLVKKRCSVPGCGGRAFRTREAGGNFEHGRRYGRR